MLLQAKIGYASVTTTIIHSMKYDVSYDSFNFEYPSILSKRFLNYSDTSLV